MLPTVNSNDAGSMETDSRIDFSVSSQEQQNAPAIARKPVILDSLVLMSVLFKIDVDKFRHETICLKIKVLTLIQFYAGSIWDDEARTSFL